MKSTALVLATIVLLAPPVATAEDKAEKWASLFNGKDLTGWTPKIRHQKVGEDPKNTFRVEDGLLKVRYDNYTEFNETFGHLFYKTEYAHYKFRVEYRFVDDQLKGGPGWAFRNSGIMVHGQDPATMADDQDFPVSIEVQLLGGPGEGKRTTGNLCTPGTHVFIKDELVKRHCTNSTSKTYHGEQWVTAEVEVRGNQVIRHIINGENVLEYQKPVLDDSDASAKPLIKKQNGDVALSSGTISLQSESHPCDFRKIEILVLTP
ncbi:MAG: DUF1080 domain-containing protein [Verrucomicrobiales bacterium]|nr:DUF1080 domain-containing protein [Verrucomicrobiales bacterium]